MYLTGDLLLFKDYKFKDGGDSKPKFGFVFKHNETFVLLSLTTSNKEYIDPKFWRNTTGIIDRSYDRLFYFAPGDCVFDNDFSFLTHTFVNFNRNVRKINQDAFITLYPDGVLKKCGRLKDDVLLEFLYCALKSGYFPRKYKPFLEAIIENLSW